VNRNQAGGKGGRNKLRPPSTKDTAVSGGLPESWGEPQVILRFLSVSFESHKWHPVLVVLEPVLFEATVE
jgi:hypothetical protein